MTDEVSPGAVAPPPPILVPSGLEPGWYWVQAFLTPRWEMAWHSGTRWRIVRGEEQWSTMLQGEPDEVGPRIKEPDAGEEPQMTDQNTTSPQNSRPGHSSSPEAFHEVVLRVLAAHRNDHSLNDFRLMSILLGEFHSFVQRADIRIKASNAVEEILFKAAADGTQPVPAALVDAVVKAVMEGN